MKAALNLFCSFFSIQDIKALFHMAYQTKKGLVSRRRDGMRSAVRRWSNRRQNKNVTMMRKK